MSERGPHNYYCHRCNSRTQVRAEEVICASCGTGFIEEILSGGESVAEGRRSNRSDDHRAQNRESESAPEGDRRMSEQISMQTSGPRIQRRTDVPAILIPIRASRRSDTTRISRAYGDLALLLNNEQGDHFLEALLDNLLISEMDRTGPPRMDKKEIDELPTVKVTPQHVDHKIKCCVCREDFMLHESVLQLRCEHIFHNDCIIPWLELRATCPLCRKPQNEVAVADSQDTQNEPPENSSGTEGANSSFYDLV